MISVNYILNVVSPIVSVTLFPVTFSLYFISYIPLVTCSKSYCGFMVKCYSDMYVH